MRCTGSLRVLGVPRCARCGCPTAWPVERCRECSGRRLGFTSARGAVAYAGAARRLVHAWKERGLRRGADLAAGLVAAHIEPPPADVITYIPPDGDRLLRRGYHPPEQLAHRLAARWSLPALPLLARTRPVDPQVGLTLAERRRNVHGAFAVRAPVPPTVLLVDDVYTTGSTASAAAGALRPGGAEQVHVVTFARTVR